MLPPPSPQPPQPSLPGGISVVSAEALSQEHICNAVCSLAKSTHPQLHVSTRPFMRIAMHVQQQFMAFCVMTLLVPCCLRGYTVNVPLKDGIDDSSYRMLYEPIMSKV